MVSRGDRIVVIWPEYYDSKRSRSQGRRVPRKYAVPDPTLNEIAEAAKSLGLNPILEPDTAYPAAWWKKGGRIILRKVKPKTVIVSRLGKRVAHRHHIAGQEKSKTDKKEQKSPSNKKHKKKKWKGRK